MSKGPGLFSDIGKKSKDLLTRDYLSDHKFSVSTYSASGVKMDVMADMFDPKIARMHLVAQLYKHVCEAIEDYKTDFDLVSQSIERDRKMRKIVTA